MTKEIRDRQGRLIAVIVKERQQDFGTEFVTNVASLLQVGRHYRPHGYVIPPHSHNNVVREIEGTSEVLIVVQGALETRLFDEEKNLLAHEALYPGDVILLASGGHEFRFLGGSTRVIEVKQGPYAQDADKEWW